MDKFKLEREQATKWLHNLELFLAPLGVVYLGAVTVNLGSGFSIQAFIPNQVTAGAITLYFVNAAMDYLRKLRT